MWHIMFLFSTLVFVVDIVVKGYTPTISYLDISLANCLELILISF